MTPHIVRTLRRRYAKGAVSIRQLAREFGVSRGCVHAAITGKTWGHVLFPGPAAPSRRPHLTDHLVRTLRRQYAAGGVSVRELAQRFGCSKSTVHNAVSGKTWKRAQ